MKTAIGGGYFKIDSEDATVSTLTFVIDPALPPEVIQSADTVSRDTRHANLYIYSYVRIFKDVTFTIGGSGDFFDSDAMTKNQFNPKFGMIRNPVQNTTVRAAAFRVMKRTLITNQTLEPTQVAGFNQFFDDLNATESWRDGVGVD